MTQRWIEAIDHIQKELEQSIQNYFVHQSKRFNYGELFAPLFQDMAEFVARKGKRIRPLLMILSYRALGGLRPWNDPGLINAALSLEFLHAFILMHDDVIDRSETRRGLPTFHKRIEERLGPWPESARVGENVAMVIGDILFAMALDLLARSSFPETARHAATQRLLQASVDTGVGEIYDILLGIKTIDEVQPSDITQMYHLKTTRYTFEAPAIIGAILADAPPEKLKAIAEIMEPLGLAFQIRNDLTEFQNDTHNTTTISGDLLEGKNTFLLRRAHDVLPEVDRHFLHLCLRETERRHEAAMKIRDIIKQSGVVEQLYLESAQLFDQAGDLIRQKAFSPEEQRELASLLSAVKKIVGIE